MKKLLAFGLLLAAGFGLVRPASADAPKARTADEVSSVVGLAHITQGNSLVVDADGRAYTREMGGHTVSSGWGDRLVYTGEAVVHKVIVHGPTADDYAEVYDETSATGTPKVDPQTATAKQTVEADLKGSLFSTGIYVNTTGGSGATNSKVFTTVVYDPL